MLQSQSILWYPMRVTYNREMMIKSHFDRLGIESFVPMKYEMEEDGITVRERVVPAIHNLIFVPVSDTSGRNKLCDTALWLR